MLQIGRPGCERDSCKEPVLGGRALKDIGINQTKRGKNYSGTVFLKNMV